VQAALHRLLMISFPQDHFMSQHFRVAPSPLDYIKYMSAIMMKPSNQYADGVFSALVEARLPS
jgi:hypothetical protein